MPQSQIEAFKEIKPVGQIVETQGLSKTTAIHVPMDLLDTTV